MEQNLVGVVQSWLTQNQNDVFSSISAVKEKMRDRIHNILDSEPKAKTMIEIFLDRSDQSLSIEDFPPADFDSFISFLCMVENSAYRKFAIIYFLIDEFDIIAGKSIEDVFDFANLILVSREQVQFVLGCINLDSSIYTPNLVTQLSFKALPKSLEFPILSSLLANSRDERMLQHAFIFYTCKKPQAKNGSVEQNIIIYTLVLNYHLYEALKYIRTINDDEQKIQLLKQMFDISLENNKEKEFHKLAFTRDEEEQVLNFKFPSENHYKRFCFARQRFDKLPEGENFKCTV